jgi:hypothetical protein
MQAITLYKTTREGGGLTVSPLKPADGTPYTEGVRLIADEGKVLTQDGENFTGCIDTDTAEGWKEVDDPETDDNTETI